MHLLNVTTASLDDLIEPVDLGQSPGEIVALSFSDSDLAALAAGWQEGGPELRLASLRDLRHPMSVDLWIDTVASGARVIVARLLGGYDYWPYGCDRLADLAREKGIALALLPGECREDDARLAELSTAPDRAALLGYFREGGPANMRALLARLGGQTAPEPEVLPRVGFYRPGQGVVADWPEEARPVVPVIFYRSMLMAADVAPIDALVTALGDQGIAAVPVFVASLKDQGSLAFLERVLPGLPPAAVVTATGFSAGAEVIARMGAPVFQVIVASTRREAWAEGARGLAPADLAMHVVLPELDGRILAGAVSFKDAGPRDARLGLRLQANGVEPDRVAQVARRISGFLRLRATPREARRVVVILPDYPGVQGRTGYAVGLDAPGSALAMLRDLGQAGYHVEGIPDRPRDLMRMLEGARDCYALGDYLGAAPGPALARIEAAWGPAVADAPGGWFGFRMARFGNVTVALAPDRGRGAERRVEYHDPVLPPRHALLAFGLWLRRGLGAQALVHLGAHGTLEWLPGKTVALSGDCFPELVTGDLPVIYPFIVSNPGEAAQAKRRIAAVTLGHLTPPLEEAGLGQAERALERLVDEYAQAEGLDRRRRERLAALIVATARAAGLAAVEGHDPETALARIDAWLCDLKDLAVKDGLHVFGRDAEGASGGREACGAAERGALIAALDGAHVPPGPSGAPARGRADVLPTGRNLYTSDPRCLPTETAYDLGRRAAEEVVRRFTQDHGDWPREMVVDLWGSASLRTGGEEIAQGLALMGCRPVWDEGTGRVTGIEVLPPAVFGRPRVDVTWRISGLFRDMFGAQIALIDAAVGAVAAREETRDVNPLAGMGRVARIFGSAPGRYGAGIEEKLAGGGWEARDELGRAYLAAGSHAFGGAEGLGVPSDGFAARVAGAQALLHTGDDPGRDLLEGSADVGFVGGFAAAVEALGGRADLVMLDTTDPARPRARSLAEAVERVVRGRAVNPRVIAGQMRHGPRGAAEFAETVDRLVGFAETTGAVPGRLIEAVYLAYVAEEAVRDFMLRENPAAALAVAERLGDARRRGLWHPRRNSVDGDLAALMDEARGDVA